MRKPLRYGILIALIVLVVAGAAAFVLYRAALHVPVFYAQELAVAPETQEEESDRMLQQATSLHADLHRGGSWQQVFEAKTVNAWLAVDLAQNHPDLLPHGIHDPRVRIAANGITLACRLDRYGMHGVVSLEVSAFVESADVIGLRVHKARLGAIPWSLKRVLDSISDTARQSDIRVQWRQTDGDPVALITLPPVNGGRRHIVHVDTIRLEEGKLIVTGTTDVGK